MIVEKERNELLTKLATTQNEELFWQVLALVRQQTEPLRPRIAPPGYAGGEGFWMAADFDEPLEDMIDYMY